MPMFTREGASLSNCGSSQQAGINRKHLLELRFFDFQTPIVAENSV